MKGVHVNCASRLKIAAVVLVLCSCNPAKPVIVSAEPAAAQREEPAPKPLLPPFELKQPTVTVKASPAPPFTYWAPEGSTIRNHPDVPGIWYAYVDGRQVASYAGDACRASEYQRYVGKPLADVPPPPSGIAMRKACETCPVTDDARPNRINVLFDEATLNVVRIACY